MATTTPNFGWAVPTSTDLVKDGAVAIETLGDSIDASLVDLKGGTTGQVLSKASNSDMDFTWVTDAAGDITGVTAGTGISGGGTSGTVTVTNSMATAIDAKGDLIGGTGADAFARLAVGANGTVLTADSAESTGLKWAAPASGGTTYVGVSAYKNVNQTISNATFTAITLEAESFDTDAFHSTSTNTSRFTVPSGKGGKYSISGVVAYATNATGSRIAAVYKNGTLVNYSSVLQAVTAGGSGTYVPISFVVNLVAGDYVEVFGFQASGGSLDIVNGGSGTEQAATNLQMSYLGA
jgi:hypothetical protein